MVVGGRGRVVIGGVGGEKGGNRGGVGRGRGRGERGGDGDVHVGELFQCGFP